MIGTKIIYIFLKTNARKFKKDGNGKLLDYYEQGSQKKKG